MRYGILVLLIALSSLAAQAQDYVSYEWVRDLKDIPSKNIMGKWISTDSAGESILFTDSGYSVYLHHAGPYTYEFSKDSNSFMKANGFFALWPPPYCYLELTDGLLLVTTARAGVPVVRRYYRKLE